jgi:hypothetical protein
MRSLHAVDGDPDVPHALSTSRLVARTLAGSWRESPPRLSLSLDELERVAPVLLESGGGSLCWWRLRDVPELASSALGETLHDAYRLHSVQAALRESQIAATVEAVREVGIEPILIKGWAVARLYPHRGLRPFGDLDVCVRPGEGIPAASAAWDAQTGIKLDAQDGSGWLESSSIEGVYERSQRVSLGDGVVRVPCAEDHLRILCAHHMLYHWLWRPLWLCDVAAAVEARGADFDWDVCLGRNERTARAVTWTVALARQLLGADPGGMPEEARADLPAWVSRAVLQRWEIARSVDPRHELRPLRTYRRDPRGLARAVRTRWPNPLEATVRTDAPLDGSRRLPYQVAFVLRRIRDFAFNRVP